MSEHNAVRGERTDGPRAGGSGGRRAAERLRSNLVALGSAAAVAVYAAGFVWTREAAQRFVDAEGVRGALLPIEMPAAAATPDAADPLISLRDTRASASARDIVVASVANPSRPKPALAAVQPIVGATPNAAAVADPAPPAETASLAVPDLASPVAAVEVPPAVVESNVVASVAATPAPPAPPPARASEYKDGTYYGWGTSRHGNIQAVVQVQNGRISAAISQCRTRYSCSVISALPPQVEARQSADVDLVSRATQSSNAFYYAVKDALSQAK